MTSRKNQIVCCNSLEINPQAALYLPQERYEKTDATDVATIILSKGEIKKEIKMKNISKQNIRRILKG